MAKPAHLIGREASVYTVSITLSPSFIGMNNSAIVLSTGAKRWAILEITHVGKKSTDIVNFQSPFQGWVRVMLRGNYWWFRYCAYQLKQFLTHINHGQLQFQYIHLDILSRYKFWINISTGGWKIQLMLLRCSDVLLPYTPMDLGKNQIRFYRGLDLCKTCTTDASCVICKPWCVNLGWKIFGCKTLSFQINRSISIP